MTKSSSKTFLAALALAALGSLTLATSVEAARGGGGGGGGGGAGANRASAGGGGGQHAAAGGGANRAAGAGERKNVQATNAHADKRTNEVRNTSVNNVNVNNNNNNVNVNKNVNVNVQGNNNGCCNNGWDNDYHPIATAAAVTATVAVTSAVIGSMVNSVPPSCVPVNYGGMVYQQCGSTWYQSQGPQYIVVNPPY